MKRCLTSLNITEIQIKPTIRCPLTPVRMAVFKKPKDKSCWRCGEMGTPYTVGGNVQLCSHSRKQYGGFLKKLKIEPTIWPRHGISRCVSKRIGIRILKKYLYSCVHCSVISNSQPMETTHVSINRRVDKENVEYLCCIHSMEYYSAFEKREILPSVTIGMSLEDLRLSETSPSQKNKRHMILLMWESTIVRLIKAENKTGSDRGRGERTMESCCLMGTTFQWGKTQSPSHRCGSGAYGWHTVLCT